MLMSETLGFFMLLMSNGILIGLMYSLIALGFVLVYKATDAVNFAQGEFVMIAGFVAVGALTVAGAPLWLSITAALRSEEHTSELQSQSNLVCRLLLEKKKKNN